MCRTNIIIQNVDLIIYDVDPIKQVKIKLEECNQALTADCGKLTKTVSKTKKQLKTTELALRDVTNERSKLRRRCEHAVSKVTEDIHFLEE